MSATTTRPLRVKFDLAITFTGTTNSDAILNESFEILVEECKNAGITTPAAISPSSVSVRFGENFD